LDSSFLLRLPFGTSNCTHIPAPFRYLCPSGPLFFPSQVPFFCSNPNLCLFPVESFERDVTRPNLLEVDVDWNAFFFPLCDARPMAASFFLFSASDLSLKKILLPRNFAPAKPLFFENFDPPQIPFLFLLPIPLLCHGPLTPT